MKRSKKSMPLWAAKLLPLLHQITKIDLGICFGFCVWFCSWVFGAGSERELCGLQELVDFFFSKEEEEVQRRRRRGLVFWVLGLSPSMVSMFSRFVSALPVHGI